MNGGEWNPVYAFVQGKARGWADFSMAELAVIGACAAAVWFGLNPLLAVMAAGLAAAAITLLRRGDNARPDHLELRLRRSIRRRHARLCHIDHAWRPLQPGR